MPGVYQCKARREITISGGGPAASLRYAQEVRFVAISTTRPDSQGARFRMHSSQPLHFNLVAAAHAR